MAEIIKRYQIEIDNKDVDFDFYLDNPKDISSVSVMKQWDGSSYYMDVLFDGKFATNVFFLNKEARDDAVGELVELGAIDISSRFDQ